GGGGGAILSVPSNKENLKGAKENEEKAQELAKAGYEKAAAAAQHEGEVKSTDAKIDIGVNAVMGVGLVHTANKIAKGKVPVKTDPSAAQIIGDAHSSLEAKLQRFGIYQEKFNDIKVREDGGLEVFKTKIPSKTYLELTREMEAAGFPKAINLSYTAWDIVPLGTVFEMPNGRGWGVVTENWKGSSKPGEVHWDGGMKIAIYESKIKAENISAEKTAVKSPSGAKPVYSSPPKVTVEMVRAKVQEIFTENGWRTCIQKGDFINVEYNGEMIMAEVLWSDGKGNLKVKFKGNSADHKKIIKAINSRKKIIPLDNTPEIYTDRARQELTAQLLSEEGKPLTLTLQQQKAIVMAYVEGKGGPIVDAAVMKILREKGKFSEEQTQKIMESGIVGLGPIMEIPAKGLGQKGKKTQSLPRLPKKSDTQIIPRLPPPETRPANIYDTSVSVEKLKSDLQVVVADSKSGKKTAWPYTSARRTNLSPEEKIRLELYDQAWKEYLESLKLTRQPDEPVVGPPKNTPEPPPTAAPGDDQETKFYTKEELERKNVGALKSVVFTDTQGENKITIFFDEDGKVNKSNLEILREKHPALADEIAGNDNPHRIFTHAGLTTPQARLEALRADKGLGELKLKKEGKALLDEVDRIHNIG
ncbi:MAG: hypothetical protein WCG27_11515, partial [Pseudomonadota bacterium]